MHPEAVATGVRPADARQPVPNSAPLPGRLSTAIWRCGPIRMRRVSRVRVMTGPWESVIRRNPATTAAPPTGPERSGGGEVHSDEVLQPGRAFVLARGPAVVAT